MVSRTARWGVAIVAIAMAGVGVAFAVIGVPDASMSINSGAASTALRDVTINSNVSDAVDMRIMPQMKQVSTGTWHSIGVAKDGTLWGWGRNLQGQIGDNLPGSRYYPIRISTDTTWKAIASGGSHNLLIKMDGSLWAFGQGAYGQLGTGNYSDMSAPARVGTGADWKQVDGGNWHSLAVKNDGSLWAWGLSRYGQLGTGSTATTAGPTQIGTEKIWANVSAGYEHSAAVKTDGSLWTWGQNPYGQLGLNNGNANVSVPTRVGTDSNWAKVVCGENHTLALKTDGTLWAWGSGGSGQTGTGSSSVSPVQVGLNVDWTDICAGAAHSLALKTDGSLWAWGSNGSGQCGTGGTASVLAPTRIGTDVGWTGIAASSGPTFAIKDDELWGCGYNSEGNLGDGSVTSLTSLTQLGKWEPYTTSRALYIPYDGWVPTTGTFKLNVIYRDTSLATIVASDTINYDFTVPTGNMNLNESAVYTKSTKVRVVSYMSNAGEMRVGDGPWVPYTSNTTTEVPAGDGVKTVTVTYRYSGGGTTVKSDTIILDTQAPTGTMSINTGAEKTSVSRVSISSDVTGVVGMASRTSTWTALAVGQDTGMNMATFGIKSNGSLWAWGYGPVTGTGFAGNQISPVEVISGTTWKSISAGSHMVAVRSDGSVWAWGTNESGQIGDSTTVAKSLPQRIANSGYKKAVVGWSSTVALKTDGSIWAWGSNSVGQLGDGTLVNRPTPVRIGMDNDWAEVFVGGNSTYALKSDGSLWAWGSNSAGKLGDGTSTNRSVPTRIGMAKDWTLIAPGAASVLGLKSDGSLWAWGDNSGYQYGNGLTASVSVPTRVGTDADWASVSLPINTGYGRKTDGSVWSWGYNNGNGSLGDAAGTGNQPTPTKIIEVGKVASLYGNGWSCFALGNRGELWGWGYNATYQLGDLTTTLRLTPVAGGMVPYASTYSENLAPGDGTRAAAMAYVDIIGNELSLSDTITVDSTPGTASFALAGGASYATSTTIPVNSDVSGAVAMRVGQRPISVSAGWDDGSDIIIARSMILLKDGPILRTVPEASFVEDQDPGTWKQVSAGSFFQTALRDDGTVWTWGGNYRGGGLGTGDAVERATPTKIATSALFSKVAAGHDHTIALATDGRLYGWGWMTSGQVGLGWITSYFADQVMYPSQIGVATDWIDADAGDSFSAGLRSGGSLWFWGLQPGSAGKYSSPTRLGTDTGYAKVFAGSDHALAIKEDGSLWAWGDNSSGQLGDGTLVSKPSATVCVNTGEWRTAAAGKDFSVAVRSDGSLWGWGLNNSGQLGRGDTVNSSVPLRIGTATDWDTVDACTTFVMATKKDGSVWSWGKNSYGQLGQGDMSARLTPTEVPMRPLIPYSENATATVPWAHTEVKVWASFMDAAGGVTWLSDSIAFDTEAPHTTITAIPATFVTTPVMFELTATDMSSGVDKVFYRIDGGAAQECTGPVTVSKQGMTKVDYWASDRSGRVEDAHSTLIRIDGLGTATMGSPTCVTCHTTFPAAHPMANCTACHFGEFGHTSLGSNTAPAGRCWSANYCHVNPDLNPTWRHGTENFTALHTYNHVDYACEYCHSARFPTVRGHVEPDLLHESTTNTEACRSCHSGVLTREHARRKDTSGNALTCLTCHSPTARTGVPAAIAANDTRCEACHGGTAGDHLAPHVGAPLEAACRSCHSDDLLSEHGSARGMDCASCHSSSDTSVKNAITARRKECSACHAAGHPHPASEFVGDAERTACSKCHSDDLVVEHAKSTTSSAALGCQACHAAGGARSSFTTWDKRCQTGTCHGGASADDPHGFKVAPVNYATACRKCHVPSLAGTHPYHNPTGNCGAICHAAKLNSPAWGDSLVSNIPTYLDTYGAFASASSQNTPSNLLHVIHAKPRWEQTIETANSKCGSCHAAAACDACHEAPIDALHANHAPAVTPWVGDTASGVINGDQSIDSHETGQSVRCGSPSCHGTAGVAGSAAGLLDDSSHPASAQYGYLANVVTKAPSANWKAQTASVYTLGKMSRSNYLNATLSVPFSGEQIVIVADKDPYRGIAEITIDGVSRGTVDLYADTTRNQVEVFKSAPLAAGAHTVSVRVTNTKNPAARATYVTVDQFKIFAKVPGKVAPRCAGCH